MLAVPNSGAAEALGEVTPAEASTSSSASLLPDSTTLLAATPKARAPRRSAAAASMQFEEEDMSEEEEIPLVKASGSKRTVTDMEADSSAKRSKTVDTNGHASAAIAAPRRNASYKYRQAGAIDFCAMCANKFTITAYT